MEEEGGLPGECLDDNGEEGNQKELEIAALSRVVDELQRKVAQFHGLEKKVSHPSSERNRSPKIFEAG